MILWNFWDDFNWHEISMSNGTTKTMGFGDPQNTFEEATDNLGVCQGIIFPMIFWVGSASNFYDDLEIG